MTTDQILEGLGGVGAIGSLVSTALHIFGVDKSKFGAALLKVLPDLVGLIKHLLEKAPPAGPAILLVALLALGSQACAGADSAPSLMQAALGCQQKLLAIADKPGACQERLLRLEAFVAADRDCARLYQGAGTGLHCAGLQ